MKTSIPGPYDKLDRDDLQPIQSSVPQSLYAKLFYQMFPHHGAQNRIMANLIQIFYAKCREAGMTQEYDPQNEQKAIEVLNSLGRKPE